MSKVAAKHTSTGKRARTETVAPEPKKAKTEAPATELEEPRKPAGGGYGVFTAKNRPELQKQCAGQPASAVSKLAGTKWKAMTAAQKKPYEEEYAKKAEQYKKDLEAFKAKGGEVGKRAAEKKAKKEKRAGKARKPSSLGEDASPGAAGSVAKAAKPPLSTEKESRPSQAPVAKAAKAAKAAKEDAKAVQLSEEIAAACDAHRTNDGGLFGPILLKLLQLQDVVSAQVTQAEGLEALKASGGLLHKARMALMQKRSPQNQ